MVKKMEAVVSSIKKVILYEKGIGRSAFVLIFFLAVMIVLLSWYDGHHYNFLENFMLAVVVVVFMGNAFGLMYTVYIDLYYLGALMLHNIYDFENYPTYDSPYGIYPGYCNLLEGIDQCIPLTAFIVVYLGGSLLRCRNIGVRWWWSLIPLYNPFALFFIKGKNRKSVDAFK